jgi:hypothetical protein
LLPRFTAAEDPLWLRALDLGLAGLLLAFGIAMSAAFLGRSYLDLHWTWEAAHTFPEPLRPTAEWLSARISEERAGLLVRERNFFGCFSVRFHETPAGRFHTLVHGTTTHGLQCVSPIERRREALTYFHPKGPVGQIFKARRARAKPLRVAVLGVGAGTLAACLEPGWEATFYDIDPAVVRVARNRAYFTLLPDCEARGVQLAVNLGDGRKQIEKAPDSGYDLIFMDAFTSDAVPVHLLTREAIQTYLAKLAPDGLVVVNISNRYLNLASVLGNACAALGLDGRMASGPADAALNMYACTWVVLGRDQESLDYFGRFETLTGAPTWEALPTDPAVGVWTDDRTNLLAVFNWSR